MFTRRHFLISTSAVFALPALIKSAVAFDNFTQITLPDQGTVAQEIDKILQPQFQNESVAIATRKHIIDVGLNWQLPEVESKNIDRIVAYAFGNRPNLQSGESAGNSEYLTALPDPGPTNEELADTVYKIYQIKPVKIYAQWEIARFLDKKYQLKDVVSIEPITNKDGTITYLSTGGVAEAIIEQEKSAENLGVVAIVAHRDHAKRCIQTSQDYGMNAFAVKEVPLPVNYDQSSGQPWTRDRETYLLHDMYVQMLNLRDKLIKQKYPQG